MENFLIGLTTGGIFLVVILFIAGTIGLIYILAKNDILFTFVEEGTAKTIMKFDGFYRVIMQYENCYLDEEWNVNLCDTKAKRKKRFLGGLHWIGIPGIYSIYKYRFSWATLKSQKEAEKQVERRSEIIKHIFVKDYVYLGEVKGAETKSLVPLDIDFLVTTRVMNPYKALFRVHDWVNVTISRIEAYFRQFVSLTEYENLIAKKQEMGGEIMKALEETGMLGNNGKFLVDYGIKVKNIEMRDIEPVGENKKVIQEAATKEWVAKKQKTQVMTLADAEVERVGKVYTKIKEFGEEGLTIRMLESIDKAGEKQGNWIIPFGSVQQILQSLVGKKKEDSK